MAENTLTPDQKKELSGIIPKEIKDKFKGLFSKWKFNLPATPATPAAPVVPAAPATQLTEATLADGTTIKYDTPQLVQGSVVSVVSPEGEMPCPAGEYKLQDGTTIQVVDKGGKSVVESVTPANTPPAAPAQQAAAPNPAEQIAAIHKVLQTYKDQKDDLSKKIEAQDTKIKEQETTIATLKNDVMQFMSVFNELLDTPSAPVIEKPANKHEKKNHLQSYINLPKK